MIIWFPSQLRATWLKCKCLGVTETIQKCFITPTLDMLPVRTHGDTCWQPHTSFSYLEKQRTTAVSQRPSPWISQSSADSAAPGGRSRPRCRRSSSCMNLLRCFGKGCFFMPQIKGFKNARLPLWIALSRSLNGLIICKTVFTLKFSKSNLSSQWNSCKKRKNIREFAETHTFCFIRDVKKGHQSAKYSNYSDSKLTMIFFSFL